MLDARLALAAGRYAEAAQLYDAASPRLTRAARLGNPRVGLLQARLAADGVPATGGPLEPRDAQEGPNGSLGRPRPLIRACSGC